MTNYIEFNRCQSCRNMVRAELKTIGISTKYAEFPDRMLTIYGNCPKCDVAIKTILKQY